MTVDRIVSSVQNLGTYPLLGRVVPEYQDANLREILCGRYRIVYRVDEDRVPIVAVVHGARTLFDVGGEAGS